MSGLRVVLNRLEFHAQDRGSESSIPGGGKFFQMLSLVSCTGHHFDNSMSYADYLRSQDILLPQVAVEPSFNI